MRQREHREEDAHNELVRELTDSMAELHRRMSLEQLVNRGDPIGIGSNGRERIMLVNPAYLGLLPHEHHHNHARSQHSRSLRPQNIFGGDSEPAFNFAAAGLQQRPSDRHMLLSSRQEHPQPASSVEMV